MKRKTVLETQQGALDEGDQDIETEGSNREESEDNSPRRHFYQQTQAEDQELRKRRRVENMDGAAAGVIESVELVDFMCHKFLKVNFGPRINFIIGHNGSGKSAILTAISICLGGKASATQRANSLKGFIREGQSCAEVSLRIRNKGPDAFKHELYGDRILIVRRISSEGTGTYKLKSVDGKTISTKRDELTAMCDHMMLQPDNPMLILNQESARQFLTSSTPGGRYTLFLRGTLLLQLRSDYQKLKEAIQQLNGTLRAKKEMLPDLQMEVDIAKRRLESMQAAMGLETKIEEMKQFMAWSQVRDLKLELKEYQGHIESLQFKCQPLRDSLAQLETRQTELNSIRAELENSLTELAASSKPFEEEQEHLNQQKIELKNQLSAIARDESQVNDSVKECRAEMQLLEKHIEDVKNRLDSGHLRAERETKQTALGHLKEDMEQVSNELNGKQREIHDMGNGSEMEQEVRRVEHAANSKRSEIDRLKSTIERLGAVDRDRNSLYHDRLSDMLNEIKHMHQNGRFKGGLPVGPVGHSISLKSGNAFAKAIDSAIAPKSYYSFVVQDPSDIETLTRLFHKYSYGPTDFRTKRMYGTYDVISTKYDSSFDCSSGQPDVPSDCTTILMEMEFSNDLVKQAWINNYSIESVLLVRSRKRGEEITRNWPRNLSACFDVDGNRIGNRNGGSANIALIRKSYGQGVATLCAKSSRDQIDEIKSSIKTLEKEYHYLAQELIHKRHQHQTLLESITQKRHTYRQLEQRLSYMKKQEQDMLNEIQDIDLSIESQSDGNILSSLAVEKDGIQKRIESLTSQYPEILQARKANKASMEELNGKLSQLAEKSSEIRKQYSIVRGDIDIIVNEHTELMRSGLQSKSKLDRYETRLSELEAHKAEKQHVFVEHQEMALEFCDQREITEDELNGLTTDKIEKELRNLQKYLEERNKDLGSVEEAMELYEEKRRIFDGVKGEVDQINALVGKLSNIYTRRLRSWDEFLTLIAIRTKLNFIWLLTHRRYKGSIKFDHNKELLLLDIQTSNRADAEDDEQEARNKDGKKKVNDPRGLSGGEKSFSTICFLLSLWEAMDSTVRALDEFDVFMDSVNRRVAMGMLIQAAKDDSTKQFILITPQAMGNVELGPETKVTKLSDPERQWAGGQRTLHEVASR